jgi:dienelactone hydrolase
MEPVASSGVDSCAMSSTPLFGLGDSNEPLGLLVTQRVCPEPFDDADCRRFELSSHGDRVPGRLILPKADNGPHPLVLLGHGAGHSKDAAHLDVAAPWVKAGAAVASIDLPLHGERASAKFSERLLGIFAALQTAAGRATREPLGQRDTILLEEFARQSVTDMARTLDALTSLPEIDARRIAFTGFSLSGALGAIFCAIDSRPLAAVLAVTGGGFAPTAIDPCSYVAKIAPRPLFFVTASKDEVVPKSSSEALFRAAGEPKRVETYDAPHSELPGVAFKAMWGFLAETLGL